MKACARLPALLFAAAKVLGADGGLIAAPETLGRSASVHFVTNVAQVRELSGADYLDGCDLRLTGVVTPVDARREWKEPIAALIVRLFRNTPLDLQLGK